MPERNKPKTFDMDAFLDAATKELMRASELHECPLTRPPTRGTVPIYALVEEGPKSGAQMSARPDPIYPVTKYTAELPAVLFSLPNLPPLAISSSSAFVLDSRRAMREMKATLYVDYFAIYDPASGVKVATRFYGTKLNSLDHLFTNRHWITTLPNYLFEAAAKSYQFDHLKRVRNLTCIKSNDEEIPL